MPYEVAKSLRGPKPAKTAVRYTDAEKAEALKLYLEVGPAEAGRRLDIPLQTVTNWAARYGVQAQLDGARAEAVRRGKLKWEERRIALAEKIGETAERALEETNAALDAGVARDARDFMSTVATAVDKAQLLTGGPTERVGIEEKFADREDEIQAARRRAQEITSRSAESVATPPTSRSVEVAGSADQLEVPPPGGEPVPSSGCWPGSPGAA